MQTTRWNEIKQQLLLHWQNYQAKQWQETPTLHPMLQHHFQTPGKGLRPLLFCSLVDFWNPNCFASAENSLPIYDVALAIELLHNATLVHDDLQDGDTHRREQTTVWNEYGAYQAINTGSALYFYGLKLMTQASLPAEKKVQLLSLVENQMLEIVEGQSREIECWDQIEKGLLREEAFSLYRTLVEKKTSALFAIPFCAASLFSDISTPSMQRLMGWTQSLGTLFQIQDDLLDVYGSKGRQLPARDIAEGKPSFLSLFVYFELQDEKRQQFYKILRSPREQTSEEQIEWCIQQMEACNTKQWMLHRLSELQEAILKEATELEKELKHGFADFAQELCQLLLQPIQHLSTERKS